MGFFLVCHLDYIFCSFVQDHKWYFNRSSVILFVFTCVYWMDGWLTEWLAGWRLIVAIYYIGAVSISVSFMFCGHYEGQMCVQRQLLTFKVVYWEIFIEACKMLLHWSVCGNVEIFHQGKRLLLNIQRFKWKIRFVRQSISMVLKRLFV